MRRCLICDDHELVRAALAAAVAGRWTGVTVTEVGDFPAAWSTAAEGYDLILADLKMPGAAGADGIARLRAAAPETPLLVVTGTPDDRVMMDLLALGVAGFVSKTESTAIILAAIELALAGGRYLPPRVAELAAGSVAGVAADEQPAPVSSRQRDVLRLIAGGRSNKEIALALGVSPATVKAHVAGAIAAIGAQNRTDAAVRARSRGWI
jgi:DNA-binding NarL/FixJ family response regulator